MSEARRLKKMAKRRRFFYHLHGAMLDLIAWAEGRAEARVTVLTSGSHITGAGNRDSR